MTPRRLWATRCLSALATVIWASCDARGRDGVPFTPEHDDQVLAEVPPRRADAPLGPARALEGQLRERPGDVDTAVALARLYIEEGRRRSDPRFMGRAEAVIAPLAATSTPAPEILVMRATLRQNRHDFAGARADLDRVIAARPTSAQAWVTRAVVATVQGDYAEAERSCTALMRLSTRLVAGTCIAGVASLTGHAEAAFIALERELKAAPEASMGERMWAISALAELAVRRGDDAAAERYFALGLGSGERDVYLMAARADYLLDRGRAPEVLTLLAGELDADALLLRRVIAEKRTGDAALAEHDALLLDRYAATRARGESLHAREEARYALEVKGDAAEALVRAREAWAVQRGPGDARMLLEAALAARDRAAAEPVITFLHTHKTEDVVLTRLIG